MYTDIKGYIGMYRDTKGYMGIYRDKEGYTGIYEVRRLGFAGFKGLNGFRV